jgi:hypothetical protein
MNRVTEQMEIHISEDEIPVTIVVEETLPNDEVAKAALLLLESLTLEAINNAQWGFAFDRAVRIAVADGMCKEKCRQVFGHIRQAVFATRANNLFNDFIG